MIGCARGWGRHAAAWTAALLIGWAEPAGAQGLGFAVGSDLPIQVDAEQGIEWEQDRQVFTARGNAVATRGDVTVHGDLLRAYYQKKSDGGTEIVRLDAEGRVRIVSPRETATGDNAVYDVARGILVVTGRQVKLVTPEDTITAKRQLEYWQADRMAVARDDALAVRGDRRLRAEVLVARFRDDARGTSRIWRIEAYDDVVVNTKTETVRAERGVYNVETDIATLLGSVKITRDGNQLNGCSAEVNLKTNLSVLKACTPAEGGGRVRGLLQPGVTNN